MADPTHGAMDPIMVFALIGAIGVGSQWLAWRLRMPAIVLMLFAGVLVGPVTGWLDPARDIGPLTSPMISIAVAIILFEGGLTLNFDKLRDAAKGVSRLVFVGAPLGWFLSAMALRFGAGLSWESSVVFGGILIVTGPTVIAPLLRQARLSHRPAALLQWEAIVNDPIGALAAVLAFEVVLVLNTAETIGHAAVELAIGICVATALGLVGGFGIAQAFRRGFVPEFMKVPVLFCAILAVFAVSNAALHESGLLAVTLMGVVIANAELPSYDELRRFKEHATVLLVSGVFVLLAASLDFTTLGQLDWHAGVFVLAIIFVVRPLTVFISLLGTNSPLKERTLIGFTGPRGVVLVAVAGLFGERLASLGIADGAVIGPLAFVLVAITVVLHGFTLVPMARFLGQANGDAPGILLVGGSRWSTELARVLQVAGLQVLMTDPNRGHLRSAREAGVPTYFGDILSEAAEHSVELMSYASIIVATDNDAYNTLVATDLGPEFGRGNVHQIARSKGELARHALPSTLGGRPFGKSETYRELENRIAAGWGFRVTGLTEEFGFEQWRTKNPEAILLGRVRSNLEIAFMEDGVSGKYTPGTRLISMVPEEAIELPK